MRERVNNTTKIIISELMLEKKNTLRRDMLEFPYYIPVENIDGREVQWKLKEFMGT